MADVLVSNRTLQRAAAPRCACPPPSSPSPSPCVSRLPQANKPRDGRTLGLYEGVALDRSAHPFSADPAGFGGHGAGARRGFPRALLEQAASGVCPSCLAACPRWKPCRRRAREGSGWHGWWEGIRRGLPHWRELTLDRAGCSPPVWTSWVVFRLLVEAFVAVSSARKGRGRGMSG